MKKYVLVLAAVMLLLAPAYAQEEAAAAGEPVTFETEMDKISYAIGTQAGNSFKKQKLEINLEMLLRGIEDAMAGREPAMTMEEMRKVMVDQRKRMRDEQMAQRKKEAAENLAKSNAFLEENKTKPGVQVLPSGLQYKVLKDGTGRTPTLEDGVRVNYRGMLIDGTEFDSSQKQGKPYETNVGGNIIEGWKEGLQLMKEGAKWQLVIPPDLGYKERGRRPTIGPNAALIFEVELLEILDEPLATTPSKVRKISLPQ
jgi:FKBP-type peptidyl-prolyl cis-trans isomerase FklB